MTAPKTRARRACRICGARLVPIVYGLPAFTTMEAAGRGELVLGGCCFSTDDPRFGCPTEHEFDELENLEPGWPANFPVDIGGRVREGLVVRSLSCDIEGRTTGSRRTCASKSCPGWFITVSWETGQIMHICSQGWRFDPATEEVRVTAGGEISARFVSPKPLGTPPRPRGEWPSPWELNGKGWRVNRRRG